MFCGILKFKTEVDDKPVSTIWCRNCAYWIKAADGEILRVRVLNLLDGRDCKVCRLKSELGVEITDVLLNKFEHDHCGPLSWGTIEDPVARFTEAWPRKAKEFAKRIRTLESHHQITRMEEEIYVKKCMPVRAMWGQLEMERKEIDRQAKEGGVFGRG